MDEKMEEYGNGYPGNDSSTVIGNSIEFDVSPYMNDSELRADIVVAERRAVRLWGQVRNCQGNPVPKALLKLVRVICDYGVNRYVGIAHTISDCDGFYQFDVCLNENGCYKILVGKADNGTEGVIPESRMGCNACADPDLCDDRPDPPCPPCPPCDPDCH